MTLQKEEEEGLMITKECGKGKMLNTNRKPNDNVRTPLSISKIRMLE